MWKEVDPKDESSIQGDIHENILGFALTNRVEDDRSLGFDIYASWHSTLAYISKGRSRDDPHHWWCGAHVKY